MLRPGTDHEGVGVSKFLYPGRRRSFFRLILDRREKRLFRFEFPLLVFLMDCHLILLLVLLIG